jgi:phosphatidate cytidylyltransferase
MIKNRVVPGLLIAGLWLLLLAKGSTGLFCFIVVLIVFGAADEYLRMVDGWKSRPFDRGILNICLTTPVLVTCLVPDIRHLPLALLLSYFTLVCYFLKRYKEREDSYDFFCRLAFGVFYIGLLGAHLVLLRFLPEGSSWLIIGTAITAGSDSGAYFAGKAFGRTKLCPNISPNKTVAGAVGGVVSGLAAAAGFAVLLLPVVNWLFLFGAAIVLSLVGIAGDLTESIIKRGTGTKDSGRCLAGHGGILDRVDSLLFVGPVLYYLLVLVGMR